MQNSKPRDVDCIEVDPTSHWEDNLAEENQAISKFDSRCYKFWPQRVLDAVITRKSILFEFGWKENELKPENEALIGFILGPAKKLTAVTARAGLQPELNLKAMSIFMSNSIEDETLRKDADLGSRLPSLDYKLWRKGKVTNFKEARSMVLVPIITTEKTSYHFEESVILPFMQQMIKPGLWEKTNGAFSKVRKVTIHKGHFKDPACPVRHKHPASRRIYTSLGLTNEPRLTFWNV